MIRSARRAALSILALVCLVPALAAPVNRQRRGGASVPPKFAQHFGSFEFSATDSFQYKGTPTGFTFILVGNAKLIGAGRTIEAHKISIDVPKKAGDIRGAEASGDVRMSVEQSGRKTTVQSQNLIYDRSLDRMNAGGGVKIHSDLEDQGTVDATGDRATVENVTKQGAATVMGGVELVLVNPKVLQGPAHFSGSSMTIDLRTGDWKLNGGPNQAKGNFTLLPQNPSGKQ